MDISNIKSVTARIWKHTGLAKDGSSIPRDKWVQYLESPQYRENLESGCCLGCLTHAVRDSKTLPTNMNPGISRLVGKDDQMLLTETNRAPVWIMKEIYFKQDDPEWVYANFDFLDETTADEKMAENIKRVKSLIASGVKLSLSNVIVAFWESADKGSFGGQPGVDVCQKLVNVKGADITANPSVVGARIMSVHGADGSDITEDCRAYSDTAEDGGFGPKVKCFSASDFADLKSLPKTSKIGLSFTTLKVKQFSMPFEVSLPTEEKTYSVATVKERVRMAKMNPRQTFRRLMIDYKQAVRAAGGIDKMDPEDVKIMKSLFQNDVLHIVGQIHKDIMAGKQIATLIGASSISKNARQASQKLQIPYRMAMQQNQKQGFISKDRYEKIQNAYTDFVKSLTDEVFGQLPMNMSEPETLDNNEE